VMSTQLPDFIEINFISGKGAAVSLLEMQSPTK